MKIVVDSLGAELISVVCDGRERSWQNPTGEWAGHAPVLFPVCGNCNITEQGVSYPVLPHGFAKRSEFCFKEQKDNSIAFRLCSSGDTKQFYPYEFAFTVTYRLQESILYIVYDIQNTGEVPLYSSCGGHDSFALNGGVGEYQLEFPQEEMFCSLLHDENGRLTGETKDFGAGKILRLPKEFLRENRTLIFRMKSRSVLLRKQEGAEIARIGFEGFPYLLLWHPLDSQMICIEPWHNLPDSDRKVDFPEKEGVFCVFPNKIVRLQRSIQYL